MTDAVVDVHKAQLIAGLKYIYRTGTITRPATKTSNGRGGFVTPPADPEPIWMQRENDTRLLAGHNVNPDQALIFVLNTVDEPAEGDVLSCVSLGGFVVKDISLDPVSAVYHCRCDHA